MDLEHDRTDTVLVRLDAPDTITCHAQNAVYIDDREVRWIDSEAVIAASLLRH